MIKNTLAVILISSALYASPIDTDTSFANVVPIEGKDGISKRNGVYYDKHGSVIIDKKVTIETKNYKVDNFWKKFSFNGAGKEKDEFTSIATTGTVRTIVEATSICTLYDELDSAGCSGQKPFLINKEALSSPMNPDGTITLMFQRDYNGTNILYTDNNESLFYPLDVERVEKYYKDTGHQNSHFNIFSAMFDAFFSGGFFSNFFNTQVVDTSDNNVTDVRQRYITNIVSGIDQEHLFEKDVTPLGTNSLNMPVSLIDYIEDATQAGSCNLFFFKLSADNFFCNMMASLPFVSMFTSSNPSVTYVVDTIQSDTENALVALAGANAKKDITTLQDSVVYQKQSSSSGILGTMVNMIKCMFFTCPKVNDVEEAMDSYYSFSDDEAITLTFAVVDTADALSTANVINDLQTFQLKGLHSLTGNEHTCQVKESTWNDKWNSHTFTPNEDTITTTSTVTIIDVPAVTCGFSAFFGCVPSPAVTHEEVVTTTSDITFSAKYMSETVQSNLIIDTDNDDLMKPSEWLTWCDYMVEKYKDNVTTSCIGFWPFRICKEVPADIKEDGYEVLSYTNVSKRGLLLDLKPIELTPQSKAVTLRYKLMSTN
jgi:hypothetical protein